MRRYNTLILICLLTLARQSIFSQERPSSDRAGQFGVECANPNFGFMVEGNYYLTEAILYFCPEK